MVESNVGGIGHAAFEKPVRMTVFTQAVCVFNLSSRVTPVRPRQIADNLSKCSEIRKKTRFFEGRYVTLDTGHLIVTGGFPFIIVWSHYMAAVSAENGGFGGLLDSPNCQDHHNKDDEQDFVESEFFKKREKFAHRPGTGCRLHPHLLPKELVNMFID